MASNGWFKGEVQSRAGGMKEISALARVASRELASPKSAPPSKLRRGLTGVAADDHAGQIELVRTAMADLDPTGWGTLSANEIEIKDLSGMGGSRTFRVSAPEGSSAVPQKLALHSRGENHDDFFMRRMGAAQQALAEHGLAPPRILEGKDWIIEPWVCLDLIFSHNPYYCPLTTSRLYPLPRCYPLTISRLYPLPLCCPPIHMLTIC